LHILY